MASYTAAQAHGDRRGVGLIMLAAALWGTVGVCTQAIYQSGPATPLSVGFFRLALATPALLLACLALLGRRAWKIAPRNVALMALIGGMLALYQVCFFTAITYVGVTIATLVTLCTAPVLVALLAAAFTRERPSPAVVLALAGALAGTLLLVGGSGERVIDGKLLAGVAFALASGLGYAVMALCGRRLAGRAHPLQTNTVAFGAGALLLLLISLPAGPQLAYPAISWALLAYLGLIPTALGYALFLAGMRVTSATVASIVTLAEPLTAALLAWALFGEQLGAYGLAGAALLVGALALLASRAGR